MSDPTPERMASSRVTNPEAPIVASDPPNVAWVRALRATARSADGDMMLAEYDALAARFAALVSAIKSAPRVQLLGADGLQQHDGAYRRAEIDAALEQAGVGDG